jgi:hypothetical protein
MDKTSFFYNYYYTFVRRQYFGGGFSSAREARPKNSGGHKTGLPDNAKFHGNFQGKPVAMRTTTGELSGKAPKVHENKADILNNGREIPQVTGGAVKLTSRRTVFFFESTPGGQTGLSDLHSGKERKLSLRTRTPCTALRRKIHILASIELTLN